MILVELTLPSAKGPLRLHPRLTVVGAGGDRAKTAVEAIGRTLRGEGDGAGIFVEVDGDRKPLTPELVKELALGEPYLVIVPGSAPEAGTAVATAATGTDDPEVAVVEAEAAAKGRREAAAAAEHAAKEAEAQLHEARRGLDADADATVRAAEARLEVARAAAAAAARLAETDPGDGEGAPDPDALRAEKLVLEARRREADTDAGAIGEVADTRAVEEALNGLRRLRDAKPKPSARGQELAGEWQAANRRLADLPAPPQPPEWLVTPALTALTEAREAVAEAEGGGGVSVDPVKVAALDNAHREVLEAEQRVMRKGSKLNRRRLDDAHKAEQIALQALGVSSYGDYLQRVAPALEGGGAGGSEDRLAKARAALADAEAVWEELHGGQASPEWTAAREAQAAVRATAFELLGREVADDELEDALRNHLEAMVDTSWAHEGLVNALREAGASVADDVADVEALASEWLAAVPARKEQRQTLLDEVQRAKDRIAEIDASLATHEATKADDAARGDRLKEASAEEEAAAKALDEARARRDEAGAASGRVEELEAGLEQARKAADEAGAALAEAEQTLERVRAAAAEAASAPVAAAPAEARHAGSAESRLQLLARLTAARAAAKGSTAPVVVDGSSWRDGDGSTGVLGLLEQVAGPLQVVVFTPDPSALAWAKGLGDRAAALELVS